MIENFKVDGFKSLKNFEISFTKGINVLVGPNGVGKTNICQALSLLSSLSSSTLYEAFTQYGGVGSTFNAVNTDEERSIKLEARGRVKGKLGDDQYDLKYIYSINLSVGEELFITEEKVEISRKGPKKAYRKVLRIIQKDNEIDAKVLSKDLLGDFKIIKKGQKTLTIELGEERENNESFLPLMSKLFFVCHLVSSDFNKIKSINIDPNIARLSCDITEPNEMLGNGRYLANTLHFMNKRSEYLSEINLLLEQILPNYQQISPEISDISYKRYFALKDSYGNKFPSNTLSDGTVKILALLVGVVKQKQNTTIIEEPENYLHPYANTLLINYLRDTFNDGICILTSHSETILNLLNPEELIICELKEAFTNCRRLDNIEEIKEVIADSGFGCGYHYIAGNLGGVPIF
ncbi:putative ATPase [Pontibacter ummariensis]|uniref:Predicted ATPase n=1 Tax=Pontibacter ummariensis TaxID=1610492 RepID=A0A239HY96_9BACT|nr:AAA family ATPase [Pontibacter ummariensis]PRY10122.1 putative ATPase [Pontibacter ummariensis]SNS86347.1 Predicted ATPase [Pontibacter ummariensis]